MRFRGFVGPSYVSQSINVAAQRCVNWYVEQVEVADEPAQSVLYPTPGCETFSTLSTTPVLGMASIRTGGADRCFAVSNDTLYEILPNGSAETRGSVETESGIPATFSANVDAGDEIFITSGGRGYILTLSTDVLTQVTIGSDASPITVHQGEFLDGFFLGLNRDNSTLYLSELNDGAATWDATQYAQRTAGSDPWQSLVVSNRDIWLFGKNTSEVWYNAGTAPFPFAAIPGAFIEEGIAAPASAARFGNTVMWLGQSEEGSCVVWKANGYTPQRVSTHAVEYAIQTYMRNGRTVEDAVAMTYQDSGHIFYVLGFPSADATWVYDGATGLWHERGTWDADERRYCAWRPQSHAFAFNKHLVGDYQTGVVYEMALDKFTDAGGGPIRRLRRTPHLNVDDRTLFYHKFQLMLETGGGLTPPSLPVFPATSSETVFTDNGITIEEGYGCIFGMPAGVPCPYTVGDWVKISNGSGGFAKLNGMFQVTAVNDAKTQFSYVLHVSAPATSVTADLGITAQKFIAATGYPQIMVRWSDDGAHTWGHEHWVSAGKIGEYSARAIWRRLGRGRNRVFEVSVTDPVPWRLTFATLDVSEGTS
jgi:hypothetical protein